MTEDTTLLEVNYPDFHKLCTSPRHLGPRWLHLFEFYIGKRRYDGKPQYLKSECKSCLRLASRDRKGLGTMESRRILGHRPLTRVERNKRSLQNPEMRDRRNARRRARYAARTQVDLAPGSTLWNLIERIYAIEMSAQAATSEAKKGKGRYWQLEGSVVRSAEARGQFSVAEWVAIRDEWHRCRRNGITRTVPIKTADRVALVLGEVIHWDTEL